MFHQFEEVAINVLKTPGSFLIKVVHIEKKATQERELILMRAIHATCNA
jgi:hypothetical protein